MIRARIAVLLFQASLLAIAAYPVPAAAQTRADSDAPRCKDHPLFTRMQNMRIVTCRASDFESFAFRTGKGNQTTPVEGKRSEIRYQILSGNQAPSALATIRNHQQAIKAIGGTVPYEDQRYTTLKISRDGKEIWAQVDTAWGGGYVLTIVEKQAMVQQVAASAEMFQSGLQSAGHVEVPGIFFDTGKSELKSESALAVAEIGKLLKSDPALKVYVVGHTDNVASLDVNLKLSQARAQSVTQALVSQHGIAAARLTARGVGPLTPVASNDNEEGRARNRRVELVKQ
jgi:outer membrane protein OmpA-like peptidoglycan-associated protein